MPSVCLKKADNTTAVASSNPPSLLTDEEKEAKLALF